MLGRNGHDADFPKHPPLWALHQNPIIVMGVRSRMRPGKCAMWLALTLIVTAFAFSLVFFTIKGQGNVGTPDAAAATLLPIIIVQGLILMLLGTNAVASGVANERTIETIDDHRLTPLPVMHKVIGFTLGLAIREYAMFAVTLPFLLFAVVFGNVPVGKVAVFYVVFLSTSFLYHLTGLVTGLSIKKTRGVGVGSSALVGFLYLIVPNLSHIGFSLLQFVTVRPVFRGMLNEEVARGFGEQRDPGIPQWDPETGQTTFLPPEQFGMTEVDPAQWADVPFFAAHIHAVWFTLILQGLLIATLLLVAVRKWPATPRHALTKPAAWVLYAGVQTLLLGSVWPLFVRNDRYLTPQMGDRYVRIPDPPNLDDLGLLLMLYLWVSLGAMWALSSLTTASETTYRHGLRRMFKLGQRRLRRSEDGSSSLPLSLALIGVTWGVYWFMVRAARVGPFVFDDSVPTTALWVPLLLLTACVLFLHGLQERFGGKGVGAWLLGLWVVPLLVSIVLMAATQDTKLGSVIGAPFGPAGIGAGMTWAMNGLLDASPNPPDYSEWRDVHRILASPRGLTIFTLIWYTLLAVVAQLSRRRFRHGVYLQERDAWDQRDAAPEDPSAESPESDGVTHDRIDHPGDTQQHADHAV